MPRFKVLILSAHLALFGSIYLDIILKILLIREIITFVYLTFILGLTLISALKLRLNLTETILYSVGASLSLVMVMGLIVDLLYSLIGIKKPLSLIPLLMTISIPTLLCSLKVNKRVQIQLGKIKQTTLVLALLPFLSIFGAYIFNIYNINILNILLILLISLIPFLISFDIIPLSYYPFAIYVASFSILYNVLLTSWYLWGWDIHHCYYWAMTVRQNLCWNPSECSLLIATIVPTIYSVITGINLIWFYKVMFPFFVSLIPIGIYNVCRKEFGDGYISALAPFAFMFYYAFYKTFPVKQIPAELFLVLIVSLLIDDNLPRFSKTLLLILFSFGLIATHYGVGYFFLIILLITLILYIIKFREINFIKNIFIIIYSIIITGWYMFVHYGFKFNQIVCIGYGILTKFIKYLLSPPARSGVNYLEYLTPTLLWKLYKYVNAFFVLLLTIGVLHLLYLLIKNKLNCRTYTFAFLSIGSYIFLFSSGVITYCMGFDRTLQISLSILSPYVITGFILLFNNKLTKKLRICKNISNEKLIKYLSLFFMIYFLFNSGFMFKITNNPLPPYCITLSKECWQSWRAFHLSEVCGIVWLKKYCSKRIALLHTKITSIASEYYGHGNYTLLTWGNHIIKSVPPDTYMYFSSIVVVNKGFKLSGKFIPLNTTPLYRIIVGSSKIYTSRYGEAYVS